MAAELAHRTPEVAEKIWQAFKSAVPGQSQERELLENLASNLEKGLTGQYGGLHIECRAAGIHARPMVSATHGRCELGDLLVHVKYVSNDGTTESRTIIYQLKLTSGKSRACTINSKQLELLYRWPPFEFGDELDGTPRRYAIAPQCAEFGSYLLEPSHATEARCVGPKWKYPGMIYSHNDSRVLTSGLAPTAWWCRTAETRSINLSRQHCTDTDIGAFLGHLMLERGQPSGGANPEVQRLVDALYRLVGLEPRYPKEFDNWLHTNGHLPDAFYVVEIKVARRESDLSAARLRTPPPGRLLRSPG